MAAFSLLLAFSAARAQGDSSYTVQTGDTAYSIARHAGLSVEALLQLNHLSGPDLHVGQTLTLTAATPVTGSYTVQPGDTAYSIARAHGLSLDALLTLNHLDTSDLRVGQRLQLPAGVSTPVPVAAPAAPTSSTTPQARVHVVQPGQTAYGIARLYGLSVQTLLDANDMDAADLKPGQSLKVPSLTVEAAPTPPSAQLSQGVPLPEQAEATPATNDWRQIAMSFMGVPYVYGGNSRSGLDCSGLVLQVFGPLGVRLPRQSEQQAMVGLSVDQSRLQPGDLVFFDTEDLGTVSHVGIYLGDGEFIHANSYDGRVSINRLSERYYTQRYLSARRVLGVLARQP
ncbi:LysM peptidoglycan-binding domain-containing protein [Deinococcus sonorensis]|uniref:LysM peptidoglycan-binding domain-containing protein n=2 Tax=Deinococcus sonorensis TaxID=309891 RepID=A0AAU7U9Q9_9DEIO